MMTKKLKRTLLTILVLVITCFAYAQSVEVPMYEVHEVVFQGDTYQAQDAPAAEVELLTTWQHESGNPTYRIYGFWDGDGKGGIEGNVFKVRFCPTETGTWQLIETVSNSEKLNGQHEGITIQCTASEHKGFWEVDAASAGKRWYQRSDGSHLYIVGNTLYSFVSEHFKGKPTGGNIRTDVEENANYFSKIRFAITGDIYPHPIEKPFLDNEGHPTDDGNFSHRPNPAWFHQRVDLAVKTAYEQDIIADIILNGPDSQNARAALLAGENGGDNTPFLRYMAARYGSYPNVWLCLSNEYNIRKPVYTEEEICTFGYRIKEFLPYPTPLSVHANLQDWDPGLNRTVPWNDHLILQNKLKTLYAAADFAVKNYWIGGGNMPLINDELAYEGEGDGWSEGDVIEAHLGAFLGASYASTGYKPGNKEGHYFAGNFKASEHTAADNLAYLRKVIDENITFWHMEPVHYSYTDGTHTSIFRNIKDTFRALQWKGNEYVLGTNQAHQDIEVRLPAGKWQVKMFDMISKTEKVMATDASGEFVFDVPNSRAVLVHFKKLN